jgi:hypothetical protein
MDTPRKRLLDTGSNENFGKLCRRICRFLSGPPSLLIVSGPTGCGKLTAAQHCVAAAERGLVEVVNQSASSNQVISTIQRSGGMLVSTGDYKPSALVITGADGIQSGISGLLECSRNCGKHVIILVNNAVAFGVLPLAELYRCNWPQPWTFEALRTCIETVDGSGLLTVQEKGALARHCNDLRQLKIATEMLVSARKQGFGDSSVVHALLDSPVHQWYNTLDIVQGRQLPTEQHNIGWIAGSYLGGMAVGTLSEAAQFAENLSLADMLQTSDDGSGSSDPFSALVLQSSMPLVTHQKGLKIQKVRLDMPRPNKKARYSYLLER